MMSATQSEPTGIGPPRLHRLFRFYDPEVLAVMTILIGLFQVLLAFPAYFLSEDIRVFYLCPVLVGAMHVAVGSCAFVCERSPSRQWLKKCLYSTFGGLLLGFGAIIMYGYAANSITYFESCKPEELSDISEDYHCPRDAFVGFFREYTLLMAIYAVVALILQFFLSISAIKGLKRN
ncbi:uncharacterized protein [Salminus brasiliensis]|uniref:uncharacterized protein n=1 Tax=Salminus brasiliensis TaxID=930266 RepID=UPI003B838C16